MCRHNNSKVNRESASRWAQTTLLPVYHCANFPTKRIRVLSICSQTISHKTSQSIVNRQPENWLLKGCTLKSIWRHSRWKKHISLCSHSEKCESCYLCLEMTLRGVAGWWKRLSCSDGRSNRVDDENYTPEMRNSLTRTLKSRFLPPIMTCFFCCKLF